MEQLNFHKQKLFALIAAGVGVIGMFLPWWSIGFFGSVSGMHEIGLIAFAAFIAAGVFTYTGGDKMKPFEGQNKLITAGCFGVAALIALIQFLRASASASFGLWLCLAAGIAGGVMVYVMKPEQFENKPQAK